MCKTLTVSSSCFGIYSGGLVSHAGLQILNEARSFLSSRGVLVIFNVVRLPRTMSGM